MYYLRIAIIFGLNVSMSPRSTNEEKTRFPGRRHQLARTQTSHSAVLNENIATLNVHSNVRILRIFLIFVLNISKSLTFCNNAKKSLGVRGTLKVEGPIAQNGSIALEVTMATKRAPTTRHRHTERVQWNTYHNPFLPIQGWEESKGGRSGSKNQQILLAVNSNDP